MASDRDDTLKNAEKHIKAGRLDVLSQVRYILTLDSDTQLPRGSAAGMVGAIAHPLNQAIMDSS